MVVDSDIVMDFFKDVDKTKDFFLNSKQALKVSRLTIMELVLGLKTKTDVKKALKQIAKLDIEIVEIDQTISQAGWHIFQSLHHSYGIGIIDSLIAATAFVLDETLVTRNIKHFKFVKELRLEKPY